MKVKARRGRPPVNKDRMSQAVELIRKGITVTDAARVCGVGRATLVRYGLRRQRKVKQKGVKLEACPYGDTMMEILLSATPSGTPDELRDEIAQQMAVEILSGDLAYALLRAQAIKIKRKMNGDYHNRFKYSSLNQSLGDTDLTLGDTLVG